MPNSGSLKLTHYGFPMVKRTDSVIPIGLFLPFFKEMSIINLTGQIKHLNLLIVLAVIELTARRLRHLDDTPRLSQISQYLEDLQFVSSKQVKLPDPFQLLRSSLGSKRAVSIVVSEIPQVDSIFDVDANVNLPGQINAKFKSFWEIGKSIYSLTTRLTLVRDSRSEAIFTQPFALTFSKLTRFDGIELISNTRIGILLSCMRLAIQLRHKEYGQFICYYDEETISIRPTKGIEPRLTLHRPTVENAFSPRSRDFFNFLEVIKLDTKAPPPLDENRHSLVRPSDFVSTMILKINQAASFEDLNDLLQFDVADLLPTVGKSRLKKEKEAPISWMQVTSQLNKHVEIITALAPAIQMNPVNLGLEQLVSSVFV
jgi:hypothetical protein